MAQANVFPTADTIDPITGMPVGSREPGTSGGSGGGSRKRLLILVAIVLLVGIVILGLLYVFLGRSSGTATGAATSPQPVASRFTGPVDPACADLAAALMADDLPATVSQRLEEVAGASNLEENQAYFRQLAKDVKPVMVQYKTACESAVSEGRAPEFYRTFIVTFDTSVTDGATVSTTALGASGQVPPADAERLRAEASKLTASASAVGATSGTNASASPSAPSGAVPSPSAPTSGLPASPTPAASPSA